MEWERNKPNKGDKSGERKSVLAILRCKRRKIERKERVLREDIGRNMQRILMREWENERMREYKYNLYNIEFKESWKRFLQMDGALHAGKWGFWKLRWLRGLTRFNSSVHGCCRGWRFNSKHAFERLKCAVSPYILIFFYISPCT